MIIAEIDDFKKARRVLFIISLSWIALTTLDVDLSQVEFAGIKFGITRPHAETILFVSGIYTFLVFSAYGAQVFTRYKRRLLKVKHGPSEDFEKKLQYEELTKKPVLRVNTDEFRRIQKNRAQTILINKQQEKLDEQDHDFEKSDFAMTLTYFFVLDIAPPTLLFIYCLTTYFFE